MNLPRYTPGPVDYWFAAALTEFINGCIDGLGAGGIVGGGSGATTALSGVGDGISMGKQVLIALTAFASTIVASGIKRFTIWHHANPLPNPWPAKPQQ